MNKYYNCNDLITKKDLNGNTPEILICVGNRTAGKTTSWTKWALDAWFARREQFVFLYRYKYELSNCSDKIFGDVGTLFYKGHTMTDKPRLKGAYAELYLDDELAGFAIAINSADQVKKNSHIFCKVQKIIFDEFMPEDNTYCPDEVKKFLSIHASIARGQGEQVRFVQTVLISNPVTVLNPYYTELGIAKRLRADTKFLRGDGFVLQQNLNSSAAEAQKSSAFNRAFAKNNYIQYAAECASLADNNAFVDRPKGPSKYLATIRYQGKLYAIREYAAAGIVYCSDNADSTFPLKISVTTDDHQINYIMLRKNDFFISTMRYYFERGCFRFANLDCKNALISALSY